MSNEQAAYRMARKVIYSWLRTVKDPENPIGKKTLPSHFLLPDGNVWTKENIENCINLPLINENDFWDAIGKKIDINKIDRDCKYAAQSINNWDKEIREILGKLSPADQKLIIQLEYMQLEKYKGDDDKFKTFICLICDAMFLHYCFVDTKTDTIIKKIDSILTFFGFEETEILKENLIKQKEHSLMRAGQYYNNIRWGGIWFYAVIAKLYADVREYDSIYQFFNSEVNNEFIRSVDKKSFTEVIEALKGKELGDYKVVKGQNYQEWEYSAHFNILLFILYPNDFSDILSNTDKRSIKNTFSDILNITSDGTESIDECLKKISDEMGKDKTLPRRYDDDDNVKWVNFYSAELKKFWNSNYVADDFSQLQGLKYKKAIILYGPPGTGKTHGARQLATNLVLQQYKLSNKDPLKEIFHDSKKIVECKIHHLQLHINYSYEDFIIGKTIGENNRVEAKSGFFKKLCDEIKNDESPHVLILDEINRVDLSRVFGEAFSALEYRGDKTTLPFPDEDGNKHFTIPDNLFIIGTMNEIDFSLERLDFALRRRFVWYFYGYNKDALSTIIDNKIAQSDDIDNIDGMDDFIKKCTKLNDEIENDDDLGKQYQIGHTFFAEIVDIYVAMKKNSGRKPPIKKAQLILWDISIQPILDAFLGTVDETGKQDKLKKFQTSFVLEK